jgi:predicted Zn-dependent protease with MMP-like domain
MNFETFRRRAEEIFEAIPPDYREGVDGLEVLRKTVLHPTLPDIYTLGECLSDSYPSDFGGAGEVRSRVVLYYGSFLELSRSRDDWDWEEELFETVTHEVRHHLEHLASEDALEETDYAEDQNFARREGEPFDPFFYQAGTRVENDLYEVDGDLFLELELDDRQIRGGGPVAVRLLGRRLRLRPPAQVADVYFLRLPEGVVELRGDGDVFLVGVRRKGAAEWVRGILTRRSLSVVEVEAEVEPED